MSDWLDPEPEPSSRPSHVPVDPADAYFHPTHPQHPQRVREVAAAYAGRPAPAPAPPSSLRETLPADLQARYRAGDPQAVKAVAAQYEAKYPEEWPEDDLEDPLGGLRGGLLQSADPEVDATMPFTERRALSHGLTELAGGDLNCAQLAYFALERGGTPPEPPDDYRPPDVAQATAILQRGWGRAYERNLELAEAVIQTLDDQHAGAKELPSEYLRRTGYNNDPMTIRLAAYMGRQWLRRGWRP